MCKSFPQTLATAYQCVRDPIAASRIGPGSLVHPYLHDGYGAILSGRLTAAIYLRHCLSPSLRYFVRPSPLQLCLTVDLVENNDRDVRQRFLPAISSPCRGRRDRSSLPFLTSSRGPRYTGRYRCIIAENIPKEFTEDGDGEFDRGPCFRAIVQDQF